MRLVQPHLPATLLCLILIIAHPSHVRAQAVVDGGNDSAVQIRVLCSEPVEGVTELKLVQDDAVLHELSLIPAMVSDPIGIGRGALVLARQGGEAGELNPVLEVPIPDAGTRFVLALFPAPDDDPDTPYQHVLIRTDGLRFGASDLYLFNLTGAPIGGTLGTKTFTLASGKSEVVTPAPENRDDRMYQARFYHLHDGQPGLFSDTRWPLTASARVYLFFVADPRRRTITYVSFREYAPFE